MSRRGQSDFDAAAEFRKKYRSNPKKVLTNQMIIAIIV